MGFGVIDASVAVKWFLEEAHTEAALALQSDFLEGRLTLRVPSIFPYEVLNALAFSRRFRDRELIEAARDLDRSDVVTVPLFGAYFEQTVTVSLRGHITIYDASYIALAAALNGPLFTADETLLKFDQRGARVIHIRDYPRPT
ncbi:MAG: type II toxin-antitoxin system VapC family toxin [Thermoplasmata archaeon]